MITLADVILGNANEHNGHKQIEIEGFKFSIRDALTLCEELQTKLEDEKGYLGCVFLNVHSDGSAAIHAGDYWKAGEHNLGHKDKLLVSLEIEV